MFTHVHGSSAMVYCIEEVNAKKRYLSLLFIVLSWHCLLHLTRHDVFSLFLKQLLKLARSLIGSLSGYNLVCSPGSDMSSNKDSAANTPASPQPRHRLGWADLS